MSRKESCRYDVELEYINIDNYSPFAHINEVSLKYRYDPFILNFVSLPGKKHPIPVHPDTFSDLGLNERDISKSLTVYPTSSFRTVYSPDQNCCFKLPLLRKITRDVRGLSRDELDFSAAASKLFFDYRCPSFMPLLECQFYADDPNFNYIKRFMPSETPVVPWFYVIKSQKYDAEFVEKAIYNIINSWMFFAKRDILMEYHTQNILVDENAHVVYRDMSDVRSIYRPALRSRFVDLLENDEDIRSIIFDRAVCNQNLDHVFKYDTVLGEAGKLRIKQLIRDKIDEYDLEFPRYSMDFPHDKTDRIPEKTELTWWRK